MWGPIYQALYRKYRSRTFDEVCGQEQVTETLKAQVASGRLSHAYLFIGTRGTASLLDLQTAYENLVKTDDQNGNDNNGNNNNGDNNNGNNNNGNNNNGNNNNGNNSGNNNANNNNNSSNKANTSAPSAKTGDITTFAPIALLLAASLSVIAFITKRRRSA